MRRHLSQIVAANKLLPNTHVTWRAAAIGTVASAFALEGAKGLFVSFAKSTMLDTYQGVYGSMALVPLVLVWIYVSWLLVLLGVEIACALQNLKPLAPTDQSR